MFDFKERIEAAEKELDSARGDIAELLAMAEAEERDLSDDESILLEKYTETVKACEKRISDNEKAQQAFAERVVEKQAPAIAKAQHLGAIERKPGELIFKEAAVKYLAHCQKLNPLDVAKMAFPRDEGLQAVLRSAQEVAATDQAGWAQELTDDAMQGYLEILRGESMAAQLWAVAGVNLNFDGYSAIKVPGRAGTNTDLASGWTGERDAIPVRSATFEEQTLHPYKWGAITTTSKELVTRSMPAIMGILQRGLVQDTATKLDNDFFDESDLIAGYRPAGIYYSVTGTPASTGGATVGDDMLTDIKNLINPIYASNMGNTMRICMHPSNALSMSTVLYNGSYLFRSELAGGSIFGIPVIQSTNAPLDELWCLDMSQIAIANGAPTIEVNDSATLVMVDDDGVNPEMGAGYPRSPTGQVGDAARDAVNNPPIRSLFQTESVAIKTVQYLSWKILRPGCVNRITGVSY